MGSCRERQVCAACSSMPCTMLAEAADINAAEDSAHSGAEESDSLGEPGERKLRLFAAATARIGGLRVVLEDLSDYGNRAAILRTVEALGLLHVHEITTNKGTSRVGGTARGRSIVNGAEKWLQMKTYSGVGACLQDLRSQRFVVLAAMPPGHGIHGSVPKAIDQIDFGIPTALVFGNEAHGVSAEMLTHCDGAFTVPLPGMSESLNVSVAVAICCHFGRHCRLQALGLPLGSGDLSIDEIEALANSYTQRGSGFTASVRCQRSQQHRDAAAANLRRPCREDCGAE